MKILKIILFLQLLFLNQSFANNIYVNMRYRYEFIDHKLLDNANASTLRTVIGYKKLATRKLSTLLEVENITELGERRYNDNVHGRSNFAVVNDPKGTEINQAYLNYQSPFETSIKIGRQEVMVNNRRFIGNSPWRSNHRSMDAIMLTNNYHKDFELTLGHITRVNRVLGNNFRYGTLDNVNINILNGSYKGVKNFKIKAYSFLLDIEDQVAGLGIFAQNNTSSNKTFGTRVEYKKRLSPKLKIAANLEYAKQSSYANNPIDFQLDYQLFEPEIIYQNFSVKAGYENLGSNGNFSMVNILGNKHGFNGFADQFVVIPTLGLKDYYAVITHKTKTKKKYLKNINSYFAYHKFYSEKNNIKYGQEYNFFIRKKYKKNFTLELRAAHYDAQERGLDLTKLMLVNQFKF